MKPSGICLLLGYLVLVVQLLLPPPAFSKLYTWTDRTGTVRRTYYPPPADQVKKPRQANQGSAAQQTVQKNQVELYVTSWCPYCNQAKAYFQSRGITYKAYDIEKDKQAAARKKQLDKQSGVPFAVVNGTRIHGYAPDQYENALK